MAESKNGNNNNKSGAGRRENFDKKTTRKEPRPNKKWGYEYINFFEGISLNNILLYLVSGYIFLFVFDFVCGFTKEKPYQFVLLKTLVCGYILI